MKVLMVIVKAILGFAVVGLVFEGLKVMCSGIKAALRWLKSKRKKLDKKNFDEKGKEAKAAA